MATAADVLLEGFGRLPGAVRALPARLEPEQVLARPEGTGNSIGWLLWHLTRVMDDHLADIAGTPQVWDDGWRERFGLPYPPDAHGYAMSDADVDAFDVADPALLVGYFDATYARAVEIVRSLGDDDWGRVVDESFDPPVTALVRLVSVLNDATAHVGQAEYVRGLLGAPSGWLAAGN